MTIDASGRSVAADSFQRTTGNEFVRTLVVAVECLGAPQPVKAWAAGFERFTGRRGRTPATIRTAGHP